MDLGSITKLAAPAPPLTPPRADALAAAGATRTDLAPDAAVQQVGPAELVRFEPSDGLPSRARLDAALRDAIDRNLVFDPKSREIVFQVVERETGEVLRQVPDEALLRLRTYVREMREQAEGEKPVVERVA
jgi:flagellar protein FlaG